MLASLWQDVGRRLAKKPFTRMSWWRTKQWISVFFIEPELTEEQPLWKREESSLGGLRLFGLEPKDLEAEIQAYWKRSFWQRGCLGLLTSIRDKLKVWSYYQRCLAFARVQKQGFYMESALTGGREELALLTSLVNWFDESRRYCEQQLEKHAGDLAWRQNQFLPTFSHYEHAREREFLKRLEKKLKKITTIKEWKNSLRRRIKKEYQDLGKLMREYLLYSLLPEQASTHNDELKGFGAATELTERVPERHELVYVGPAVDSSYTLNLSSTRKASLGDADSVSDLICRTLEETATRVPTRPAP